MNDAPELLSVRNLTVDFATAEGLITAVDNVSFDLREGEILALVGESGCGKSATALALLRLIANPPGRIASGSVAFRGQDLLRASEDEIRDIRGNRIAMIFQEPMTSLNPVLTVGRQIGEPLMLHEGLREEALLEKCVKLLESVSIPEPRRRMGGYPHQFSGGMRQRVMIAMGMGCAPDIIIADEPTTALDVTIQAQLLELLRQQVETHRTALMLITHNLGIVARYADRVNVMYAGRIVESAGADDLYERPRHPYTIGLLRSVPRLDQPTAAKLVPIPGQPPDALRMPQGCAFHPRCPFAVARCRAEAPALREVGAGKTPSPAGSTSMAEPLVSVRGLEVHFPISGGLLSRRPLGVVHAVDGVDLDIARGETLGLVGESGCGKSTLGRAILQLVRPTSGEVRFDGQALTGLSDEQVRPLRRRMQMVFQDPFSSLNPRMKVGDAITEPMLAHGLATRADARDKAVELFRLVGLNPGMLDRYPHEFSGGQRQRVGVARALAVEPDFIVCDEPVSALDVSIQAQIVNLFEELRERLGLTYVFVAHDLAVVRHLSDRVAVMYLGQIVEVAPKRELYAAPLHPYTRALLSAAPVPDRAVEAKRERILLQGEVPSPLNPPAGCRLHPRCPHAMPECRVVTPRLRQRADGHWVACHLYGED